MLVQQSVIGDKARKVLEGDLSQYFEKVKDGEDLNSVVEEVLNDRDLFDFLMVNLKKGTGLKLGYVEGFDDIAFYMHYGLTVNLDIPRKIEIFGFESLDLGVFVYEQAIQKTLRLCPSFPYCNGAGFSNGSCPSAEKFSKEVNMTLQDSQRYVVQLPFRK